MPNTELIQLYDLADQLYRVAPWQWMLESPVIGVKHPESGEMGYLSVMGAAGNHRSIALYLGENALDRFNLIQEAGGLGIDLSQEDVMALILESRQVQVSFADRDELFKPELAEIKALGRKYRGGNWPCFRSFKAGWAPLIADGVERAWLRIGMEQLLAVAPGLQGDYFGDSLVGPKGEVFSRECKDEVWTDTWTPAQEGIFAYPTPEPQEFLATKVGMHKVKQHLECQFQIIPNPIGTPGRSATFPYFLCVVDAESGMVLGMEILSVEKQAYDELIASVPDCFLRLCDRHSIRPASIRVATQTTQALLEKTAKIIKVPLLRQPSLPLLNEAITGMMELMYPG